MKVLHASVANGFSLVSGVSVLPISCCVFPLALSFLGASGLAFAAALEPYRPYFLGLTLISLAAGFYFTYRSVEEDCVPGTCVASKSRKLQVLFLWIVTVLVLALMAFPYLVPYLPV